ncbi:MAG TPA: hypothetical protein VF759_01220 [Allosphingosinicella sp.]|jgi:hypothetical protein
MKVSILIAAFAALGAQSPKPRPLLCVGVSEIRSPEQSLNAAFIFRYRIDIAAMRWCAEECASWQPIVSHTPELIVLLDTRSAPQEGLARYSAIDPRTLAYFELASGPGSPLGSVTSRGRCQTDSAPLEGKLGG